MNESFANIMTFALIFGGFIVFVVLLGWTVHLQMKHKAKNNKKEK